MAYPIMVILTNRECGICHKMRGETGWPKDNNPVFDQHNNVWNNDYFLSLLKSGFSQQNSRVIEINYESLSSNPRIAEVTFFDLEKDDKLMVRKYIRTSDGQVSFQRRNLKTGFLIKNEIRESFDKFISKYVPIMRISRFLHVFPLRLFFHSQIWYDSIEKGTPLYGRVQGYRTIRLGHDYEEYGIQKSEHMDPKEKNRNPVDILNKLIVYRMEPLGFPYD